MLDYVKAKEVLIKRSKVVNSGCHEFQGATTEGYGRIKLHQKLYLAHRLAMQVKETREIAPNELVCHRCDNRLCVNPDHLFLGSYTDNRNDAVSKGRHARQNIRRGLECVGPMQVLLEEYGVREIAEMIGWPISTLRTFIRKHKLKESSNG